MTKLRKPIKPDMCEPRMPKKPKVPGKITSIECQAIWPKQNSLIDILKDITTPIIFKNDEFTIKVTKAGLSLLTPDKGYDRKYKSYKEKLVIYNEKLKELEPDIAKYRNAMKQYNLDLARYMADKAERDLLKAKKDFYS